MLGLLQFLVVENPENRALREAIPLLEPFPAQPAFRELRAVQQQLKYRSGAFSLRQVQVQDKVQGQDKVQYRYREGTRT